MVLFVNGCVREQSRTLELAQAVLAHIGGAHETLALYPNGAEGLSAETLRRRDALLAEQNYAHPMFANARQFAAADTIVLAAPYWDLAFPTKVRAYLEEVAVAGITFRYGEHGIPQGLCRAKQLVYVTTAGGPIMQNFGFDYVKALACGMYGIKDVRIVKAEGLDIWGADASAILNKAKESIPAVLA